MALMARTAQSSAAGAAVEHALVAKAMNVCLMSQPAGKNGLYPIEERLRHQRLMHACKRLAGLLDPNDARVKGVVEDGRESIARHFASASGTEAPCIKLVA